MSLLLPVLYLNVTIAISFYPVILLVLAVYGITEIITIAISKISSGNFDSIYHVYTY